LLRDPPNYLNFYNLLNFLKGDEKKLNGLKFLSLFHMGCQIFRALAELSVCFN